MQVAMEKIVQGGEKRLGAIDPSEAGHLTEDSMG